MNIAIDKELVGKGYIKNKYSVNTLLALKNNEKPINKWEKYDIIERTISINDNLSRELLNKIDGKIIKSKFLKYTGFHHVGKNFISMAFFTIDDVYIKNLNDEDLKNLIDMSKRTSRRKKRILKTANQNDRNRIDNKLRNKINK